MLNRYRKQNAFLFNRTQSKIREEFQGVFGKRSCCKCLRFTCSMRSRPFHSTPEPGIWRCEKQYSFLQHQQRRLLAPWIGLYLWFCAFNPEQRLLTPNRGRSWYFIIYWYFLLQDVCSASLSAWESTDVPESSFAWWIDLKQDAEREGAELKRSGQGQPGRGSSRLCSFTKLSCSPGNRFTFVSAESEGKMFCCSFKVSSVMALSVTTTRMLLDNLFPWNVTKMLLEVCGTETWMRERWIQTSRKMFCGCK